MKPRTLQAAFSLIEAVVAMMVVGMMVSILCSGILYAVHSLQWSRDNAAATQVMVDRTEVLRLVPWETVTSEEFNGAAWTEDRGNIKYIGRWRVGPCPFEASYSNDLRMVTVQLDWETRGIPRVRFMTTLVARQGLRDYLY